MLPDWPRITRAAAAAQVAANRSWCAYLYDLETLRRHAGELVASLPREFELFYAVKANSDAPILQTLAPVVAGFEVASGGELDWVRAHCPDATLVFGGPGKADEELTAALEARIEHIHVESLGELERLGALTRRAGMTQSILLRMNLPLAEIPDAPLAMGGRATPFGIDVDILGEALVWLANHPELRLEGFHFHLISGQRDATAHIALLETYVRTVQAWNHEHGLDVRRINLGGGVGINYQDPECGFDWPAFTAGLARLVTRCGLEGWRLRFEMGRYVAASCGVYAMEVLDIKRTLGRTFVVARGGTHHFRTPYAQGHSHPFRVLPADHWRRPYQRLEVADETVTVVGQLCTPKDVLASNVPVGRVRVGDLLLFPLAGAYAWHISHHEFLRHPHPQQIFLPTKEVSTLTRYNGDER
jgi:diaminopimelate decarboxylase